MKNRYKSILGVFGLAMAASLGTAQQASASDAFSGEFSAGYDSRYIFRGLWFGNDTVWTNVEMGTELAPNLVLSGNIFYTDVMSNTVNYSEANVGANLAYSTDFGTFDVGVLHYAFLDGFAGGSGVDPGGQTDATEFYVGYSTELFYGIELSLLAAHDVRISAEYFELGLSKSWKLGECVGLDFSAALGYGLDDYYSNRLGGDTRNGFTHTLVSLAMPIALSDNVTLTPHVSCNFALEARDASNAGTIGSEEVFYGASIGVTF